MNTVDLLRRLDDEFIESALCAATLEFSGQSHAVEVLALSSHSADLRCPDDLLEDGPVTLSIDGFGSFAGELVRRHGRIIGMIFKPGERGAPPAPGKAKATRSQSLRQHPRSAVFWSGALQAGRDSIDCIVLNMSPGGAKVKLFRRFVGDGSPVVLHVDRLGGYASDVVWSEGDAVGLRFLKDPKEVAADIERQLGPVGQEG